jgi:hypothetical protein
MSQQQSDQHGPAVDEALKDDRHQSSAGTRHKGQPTESAVDGDVAMDPEDESRADQ